MLVRNSFSLFTSLYKNITNDLFILRVLVAQWIEHPPGVRKVVGSKPVMSSIFRRQRVSVVRVQGLNAEDPGSNPRLGLLNEFVLGDPRGNFTTLCK